MARPDEYTITLTGPDLQVLGDPISGWTDIDCTIKHNEVGVGSFTAPAVPQLLAMIEPNNRVRVERAGQVLISGPIEKPGAYTWSAGSGATAGLGAVTVHFADNLAYLAERLTYPDPAAAADAQTVSYYTATATNGEVLMRALVDVNAGPGAILARRVPGLTLGTLAGVGTNVAVTTRFEPLTDVLRQLAIAAGGLGFRVREVPGPALVFEVYQPTDRSQTVRFARSLGNLRELKTDPEAPTATLAIVGGTGEGASRVVVERTAVTAWRRIETFVNQSGVSDSTGLSQYGDTALKEKAEKINVSASAVDTPALRYGAAYNVGDLAPVELATGAQVVDVVSSVNFKVTPTGGEIVTPSFGAGQATTDDATVAAVREMLRRLGRVERI